MAYDLEKLTKLKALQQLAERIEAGYSTKTELTESVQSAKEELTETINTTKTELTEAINAKVSSVYRAGGSVTFDKLPERTQANVGLVVDVSNAFTTDANFLEEAGVRYPAGTNVAVIEAGGQVWYDVLSGFVDLSGYVEKEEGKGLSDNNFTTAEKEKLQSIALATDAEVTEMLTEVFGAA